LLVSSCTSMEQPRSASVVPAGSAAEGLTVSAAPATDTLPPEASPEAQLPNQSAQEMGPYVPSEPTLYSGTDQVIRMPAPQTPVRFIGEAVSLNFEQAPLTEVVHAILGDILELDYMVEHPISGEVTLRTRTPVPRDELLGILESLLQANNALMIRDDEGRFFISASGQMSKLKPSIAASTAGVVGYSTVIVPLQYISARNMAEILRPVADEAAFVRIDDLRNLLMLAGSRTQLEGWQEIITTFDVDLLQGMSVGIFPIENSSLEEVAMALTSLLGEGGAAEGLPEGMAGLGSAARIIPIERLNSIMVVAPRAHFLQRIKLLIDRLDQAPDENLERRLYVYPIQNTDANHLAELLSSVFAGSGGGGKSRNAGIAPGLTPETVSSSDIDAAGDAEAAGFDGAAQATNSVVLGDVRVVADEENNALLIYATGKEYRKIESALERLDIAPTQVIIEASIIEVTLTDNLQYGLEWSFNNDLGDDYTGIGKLVDGLAIGAGVPGFSYSVINSSGDIKAVLNALADNDLLNVISSPSVMVLDNQTASIQVGDQVPIQTGSTITDGGTTISSITYKDTGVQLSVTPSVNAGGMVTMEVDQSVTDVGPVDVTGAGERTFLERKIISRVAVRSGESVVLGGLIRENKGEGSSGIPLLHNLPVIGALFGTKTQEGNRTELLVVITPRVIYSDSDLRDVSREMRSQLQGLELIDQSRSSYLGGGAASQTSSEK